MVVHAKEKNHDNSQQKQSLSGHQNDKREHYKQ